MKANERNLKDECRRLSSLPLLLPADPRAAEAAAKEIMRALLRHCQSDEHVSDVITTFLEDQRDWRNPVAELVQIARTTQRADAPQAGCDVCFLGAESNTGEIRWATHVTGERHGYTYAARCNCERGQWLAARDAERQAEKSA